MEHRQPEVETIVREAQEGKYAVPEFQRGFVWSATQVRELADSLSRDFPVGSILTWKSKTAIQRGNTNQTREKSWLIDGQQRTTALCTLFDRRPDWWDDRQNGSWIDHITSYDIRLDIGTEDITFITRRARSNRYVPVREILNADDLYALAEELIQGGRAFTERVGTLAKHLERVANIKKSYLPIIEIDDNIELTEVAEIFKRLNSTGTRVQQADIYLGVIASRNPGWVNQNFLKFLESLDSDGFEIEPAFLFRAFTAIGAGRTRFRDIPDNFWDNLEQNSAWSRTKTALQAVCQGLRQYGIVNSGLVLSLNSLVAAATYRERFPERSFGPFFAWMLCAVREGFFAGPTETKLDQVTRIVREATSEAQAIEELDKLLSAEQTFTPDEFVETGSGRNSIQRLMIYLIAYKNDARDWAANSYRIRAEASGDYSPEWHHIFPRKWLKDNLPDIKREKVDSVANMAVISAHANRNIAAKSPRDYMQELDLANNGRLEEQAVPDPRLVSPEQYEEWLQQRAERLAAESNKYLEELRRGM